MSNTWECPPYTYVSWVPQHYSEGYAPDFQCERCVHYKGGTGCDLDIFIYASGIDMSTCLGFKEGVICRHCGKRT